MRRLGLLCSLAVFVGTNPGCLGQARESFPLFAEGDENWISGGDAVWTFVDGVLQGSSLGGSGFVMTRNSYSDYIVELEFYPDSTVNSGVFLRCTHQELSNKDCYEFNIWDHHPEQQWRTGAVVNRSAPLGHASTIDRWNTFKIKCRGNRMRAWVNGTLMIDIQNQDLGQGYIGLQAAEVGTIRFRNVKIQLLPTE